MKNATRGPEDNCILKEITEINSTIVLSNKQYVRIQLVNHEGKGRTACEQLE